MKARTCARAARAALAVALVLAGAAGAAEVERTGTVDTVSPDDGTVVINDARYRVAPGTLVHEGATRSVDWRRLLRPGQHVRFTVSGESGGRSGVVTGLEIMAGPARASSE